jgi:hypothetical protein
MIHADAVRDRNGGEFPGRAPSFRNSSLGGFNLKIVGHVAGRLFALHADYPDHRFGERLVVQAHGSHEGAVRRTIETIGRHAGSPPLHAHNFSGVVPANAGSAQLSRRSRHPRLLQRRDDARVLELRDVHFWKHSRGGVDV